MLYIILFVVLLVADLATKYIISASLIAEGTSRVVIPDILTFIYSENYGASFGILSNYKWLILLISISACVGMFIFLIVNRKADKFLKFTIVLILAGAVGNIYDRLVFGFVRDFIDYTFLYTWFNINFAICNVADIFLTVGAVLLIFYVIFIYKETPKVASTDKIIEAKESDIIDIGLGNSASFVNYDNGVTKVKEEEQRDALLKKDAASRIEVSEEIEFSELKKEKVKVIKPVKTNIEVSNDVVFSPDEKKETKKAEIKSKPAKSKIAVSSDVVFSPNEKKVVAKVEEVKSIEVVKDSDFIEYDKKETKSASSKKTSKKK